MIWLAWAVAVAACLPLAMTLVNLVSWTRGRAGASTPLRVSVLIPARNEQGNIEACIRAALASRHPVHEVVVIDDGSTDDTSAVIERVMRDEPRVRSLRGRPLPSGWVGKAHACEQLRLAARGELLIFADADTCLEPEGVERLVSLVMGRRSRGTLVTAVPRQITGGLFEALIIPLLLLTYNAWLPLALVAHTRDPRVVAANGQLVAVLARDLEELGGFGAVAHEIVDDVALCRHAKKRGWRVVFADGFAMARCRMYRSARGVWEGFSKNIYEGIGESPLALALVAALYSLCFLAPFALGVGAAVHHAWVWPATVALTAVIATRALLAWRHRQPWHSVLLHPLGIVLLLAIAVNSSRWTRQGALRWAGRVYAPRAVRLRNGEVSA